MEYEYTDQEKLVMISKFHMRKMTEYEMLKFHMRKMAEYEMLKFKLEKQNIEIKIMKLTIFFMLFGILIVRLITFNQFFLIH